jgi:hypothetical protein
MLYVAVICCWPVPCDDCGVVAVDDDNDANDETGIFLTPLV